MKLPDGHYHFENLGDPPQGWEADAEGDVLHTQPWGDFTWDEEHGYYVQIEGGVERRLYVEATGTFAMISDAVPPEVVVGTWGP